MMAVKNFIIISTIPCFGLAHQCGLPNAAKPALALLRPTNRDTALSVLVHCIPPISRFARRAGLVTSRQTFVRRCHRADDVHVVLHLDRAARLDERDRRRRGWCGPVQRPCPAALGGDEVGDVRLIVHERHSSSSLAGSGVTATIGSSGISPRSYISCQRFHCSSNGRICSGVPIASVPSGLRPAVFSPISNSFVPSERLCFRRPSGRAELGALA